MPVRIGELLLKEKRITPAQLQEALTYQKTNGGKLGFNLVKLGYVKDEEITGLLSKQYGVPSINLTQFDIDPSVVKLVPGNTAQKYQIVPLSRAGATLTIAMMDPTNVFAMDDIKFMTGYNVEPVVASETAVLEAIQKYYGSGRENGGKDSALEVASKALEELPQLDDSDVEVLQELDEIDVGTLERQGGEAPVIRLVNVMLMSAIQKEASDIHIEPLMDIVLRESERLNETIKSFLAYARPQRFSTVRLDVRRVINDAALLLRHSAEAGEGHQVDVDVPADPVWYEADEGQIRQIIWNLATNGLRAMPDGGRLLLSAARAPRGTAASDVILSVQDQGVGIASEELDGILQPFRGTFEKGSGLGLAIVHRIVSDYGGEIKVTSHQDVGTTVTVRLPVGDHRPVATMGSPTVSPERRMSPVRAQSEL